MRRLFALAVFIAIVAGCGLFTQTPVCPKKHPNCWMNDPVIYNGGAHDAGADTD